MNGLNKTFIRDPVAFMNRLLLVTRPGQTCSTCHCAVNLGEGHAGLNNPYFRPEPMVIDFDLVGGAFTRPIGPGQTLSAAMEAVGGVGPVPQPSGLQFTDATAKYADLRIMKTGSAREGRTFQTSLATRNVRAYWLPWANAGVHELHLNDPDVKFFFTAMFSGCTFAVATPAGLNGAANPWVTHIAWNPGPAAPAGWGGAPFAGGNIDAQRLSAEAAFYAARGAPASDVRSIVLRADPLITAGRPPLPAAPVVAGAVPAGNLRLSYGRNPALVPNPGNAFIAGWRDNANAWHFAVQITPSGHNAVGAPTLLNAAGVVPLVVRQFV